MIGANDWYIRTDGQEGGITNQYRGVDIGKDQDVWGICVDGMQCLSDNRKAIYLLDRLASAQNVCHIIGKQAASHYIDADSFHT